MFKKSPVVVRVVMDRDSHDRLVVAADRKTGGNVSELIRRSLPRGIVRGETAAGGNRTKRGA